MTQKGKIRILIVEDNPVIAEDLAGYMSEFGHSALDPAESAEAALKSLKSEHVDLILLDVGLEGEIDGIQLANIIRDKYDLPFIFLTALHDEKTIERIKSTRPNAYLVKPIDDHSLKTTIEVALYNFMHKDNEQAPVVNESDTGFAESDHFFVKVKQGLLKIAYSDVMFFEAYDNYSYVHLEGNKHLISLSLKNIEGKLPKNFLRAHRSYIINIDRIERLEEDDLIIGSQTVPIGKTFRNDIMRHINLL